MDGELTKDRHVAWQHNQVTMQIWNKLCHNYNAYQHLRSCEPDKVQYYRCMADMMDDLEKLFVYKD